MKIGKSVFNSMIRNRSWFFSSPAKQSETSSHYDLCGTVRFCVSFKERSRWRRTKLEFEEFNCIFAKNLLICIFILHLKPGLSVTTVNGDAKNSDVELRVGNDFYTYVTFLLLDISIVLFLKNFLFECDCFANFADLKRSSKSPSSFQLSNSFCS